jgi:hypothetical protein
MVQVTAYIKGVDFETDRHGAASVDVHLRIYPETGQQAEALLSIFREWLLKGAADLEFADPPAPPPCHRRA